MEFMKLLLSLTTIICLITAINTTVNNKCATVTNSSFSVDNIVSRYWFYQSSTGCIGYNNVRSNCTFTMGFCVNLIKNDTGCQDSSLCVKTFNGTGKNSTVSKSVGKFEMEKSPFIAAPDPGNGFIARFQDGSNFTKKDNSTCVLQSEVHFLCNSQTRWTTTPVGHTVQLPKQAFINNSFDEVNCKFSVYLQYDGACIPILPPVVPDTNLSVGSVLIIIFVVVVSTYFVFGCTFKFCYGFRGAEVLPHSQFWIDLPVLIVDGILFTLRCGQTETSRTYDGI